MTPMQPPLPALRVDWKEYFADFKRKHGQPLKYDGRWWFADGWSYATDYRGPEYPPPESLVECRQVQLKYWRLRKMVVDKDAEYLEAAIANIRDLQRQRDACDAPVSNFLSVKLPETDQDGNVVAGKWKRVPLSLGDWEVRLKWLKDDSMKCLEMMTELGQIISG